jgi:hypothetical protein
MVTSVKEIKQRLSAFLADPDSEHDFREWFALMLRDVHLSNDQSAEALAHEIMWAFYDQKRGLCSGSKLMDELKRLATDPGVYFVEGTNSVTTGTTSTGLQVAAGIAAQQVGVGPALEYA